jgi:hypothetical protein
MGTFYLKKNETMVPSFPIGRLNKVEQEASGLNLQKVTDNGSTTTNIITVPGVQINTASTPSASAPGLIQWNSVDGTYDMGLLNSSVLQVGQETMFYGKASGAIANGDLCQFAGVQGDHILIKKAVGSEIEAAPHYLVGVATENIANGTFGYVTWFGKVNGIYTKTPNNQDSANWVAGDVLYFNVTTGQMTKTMPTVPNRIITVAAVIKAQTGASENGIIIVRPTFGQKLQDLDDVNGTTLTASGQIPNWTSTGGAGVGYFDFDKNINDYASKSGNNDMTGVNKFGSATNYLQIDASGNLTLVGTATVFDDEKGDVLSLRVEGPGVSANVTESTVDFVRSANLSDYIYTNVQMSHRWKIGSVVYPHIHYFQTVAGIPNFLLQYRWQKNGGAKTTAWTNYKCNTAAFTYTTGTIHQIAHDSGITPPAGSSLSDIIQFRIIRDVANSSGLFAGTDPDGSVVGIISFDVHTERDKLGSNSEYIA